VGAVDLILASASPRRRTLLSTLGVAFECRPADIDETPLPGEAPRDYVARVAQSKAQAVAVDAALPVLAADTTVVLDERILGKPESHEDAMRMLRQLAARTHQVYTALCLCCGNQTLQRLVCTEVRFTALSEAQCAAYIATGEPWDKAGGYGIQGVGGALVEHIVGSYSNVVGLPLHETWQMLAGSGITSLLEAPKRAAREALAGVTAAASAERGAV